MKIENILKGDSMDIDSLGKGIGLFSAAISALRQALELIPDPAKKREAMESADRAEIELKVAEAEMARQMGYKICLNHFPPGIMVKENGVDWVCNFCGAMETNEKKPPKYFRLGN